MTLPDPVIQIRNLTVKTIKPDPNVAGEFRTEPLLRNIQLQAYPGEIVLLLGGSGTGKSLLTNLMLGFISPYHPGIILENSCTGRALRLLDQKKSAHDEERACFNISVEHKQRTINCNLLAKRYPQALEGKLGVMFQSLGLFDDLTVEENWEIANDQSTAPRRGKEWATWKSNLIQPPSTSTSKTASLHLPQNVLRCNVNALSGGQKQRVALGRLLAFRPPVLIFDEPTSALDIATAKQVVQLIQEAHQGTLGSAFSIPASAFEENHEVPQPLGSTSEADQSPTISKKKNRQVTVIITHDYENFLEIADRVWFIRNNTVGEEQQTIETYCKTSEGWQNHLGQSIGSSLQLLDYFQKQLMARKHDISNLMKIEDYSQRQAQSQDVVWDNAIPYMLRALFKAIRPQSYRWWLKFFVIMSKLLVLRAVPYILLTGFFLGMVATYFSLNTNLGEIETAPSQTTTQLASAPLSSGDTLPLPSATSPSSNIPPPSSDTPSSPGDTPLPSNTTPQPFSDNLPSSSPTPQKLKVEEFLLPTFYQGILSGFGVVMFRALIPLFTCIFIAARSGTAVTSYLSSMRDPERRQWDSLRNLGIEPYLFFLTQILICFVLGCLVLSYLSFLSSALGSLLVTLATNPLCTWYIWVQTFWDHLSPQPLWGVIPWIPIFEGFPMFMAKTMCAGFAIAIISFAWGVKSRKNTIDTIRYLIGANICNMVAVLAIFFLILIHELG